MGIDAGQLPESNLMPGEGDADPYKQKPLRRVRLSAWEQFSLDWFSWDSWILAAYRGRIDYFSFRRTKEEAPLGTPFVEQKLTTRFKNSVIRRHRDALLNAIKNNDGGEHYNYQALLYMFARICVFLIATSSGFVIANIFGAHVNTYAGLGGLAAQVLRYGLGVATFLGVYAANVLTFQSVVPDVIRKIFEWDGKLGWQFFSPYEMKLYRFRKGNEKYIRIGYDFLKKPNEIDNPEIDKYYQVNDAYYVDVPPEGRKFLWWENVGLIVQFVLSALVGLIILSQTVTKSQGGMVGLLPFLEGMAFPFQLAWVMGIATFCCLLAQYTFSTMEVIRKRDVHKGYVPLFRKAKNDNEKMEVYLHNFLMLLSILSLGFFVFVGMYGTSKVQAKSFLDLIDPYDHFAKQQRIVAKLTLTGLAMAGKLIFTIKALGNFICLICAGAASLVSGLLNGGRFKSPITMRNTEEELTWKGFAAVMVFAFTKAFTAIDPPGEKMDIVDMDPDSNAPELSEPIDSDGPELPIDEKPKPVSKLYSPYFNQRFMAGAAVAGAGIRCIHEPLSRQKPNGDFLPNLPSQASDSPKIAKVS